MRTVLSLIRSRSMALFGACGLALVQVACAHPVVVEPSVVVQARLGGPVYGSIYAPLYGPAPVVMAPQSVWVSPSPAVVVAPQMMMPAPGYRHHHHWHGQGVDHGWGRRGW